MHHVGYQNSISGHPHKFSGRHRQTHFPSYFESGLEARYLVPKRLQTKIKVLRNSLCIREKCRFTEILKAGTI